MLKSKKKGQWKEKRIYANCKRAIDCLVAALGLVSLLPLFFAIAFAIRITSRGPIFFRQVRMGRSLEPFLLYKFRTMSVYAPRDCATAALDRADCYITRVGAFLRATSLDELPQLYNVLRGDMSLLGPRPVVLAETDLISRRAVAGVYRVRPGISGLAQVRGRDMLSDQEKVEMDGRYAAGFCFFGDLWLFISTVFAVMSRRHIREGKEKQLFS